MVAPFYRAFEDRYRGSRELILERLQVYVPFLEPFKEFDTERRALDLGCGRGEWLETVIAEGFDAVGIDMDDGMLEGCRARSLPARRDDALSALSKSADASLSIVSGFHIAEHIAFDDLQQLIAESLRALKPGGLLILETPNPENMVVGTNNFYLDPTHERPIPHMLLSFMAEFSGFSRTKVLRLQERASLRNASEKIGIMSVLEGSSPDYAIIAQKNASPETLELFDRQFSESYGLALQDLATRYDQGINERFDNLENKLNSMAPPSNSALMTHLETLEKDLSVAQRLNGFLEHTNQVVTERNTELLEKNKRLQRKLNATQQQLNDSLSNAHEWHLRAVHYEQNYTAIISSSSWKVTRPFRFLFRVVKGTQPANPKLLLRMLIVRTARFCMARPLLSRSCQKASKMMPESVRARLRRIVFSSVTVEPSSGPLGGELIEALDTMPMTSKSLTISKLLTDAISKKDVR